MSTKATIQISSKTPWKKGEYGKDSIGKLGTIR